MALGIAAAIGVIYSTILAIRILTDKGDHVELDDRLCHGVAPPVGYSAGFAAAIMFHAGSPNAAIVLAAALFLLLCVNIRNAWDSTLFLARKHTAARDLHS